MSKKFWVCCQNAHPESFWTSSNDRVPRIRTLRDRTSRGMTVLFLVSKAAIISKKNSNNDISEVDAMLFFDFKNKSGFEKNKRLK